MTGWKAADAIGQPLESVFTIVNEESRKPAPNPVARVLHEGLVIGLANHTVLMPAMEGKRRLMIARRQFETGTERFLAP
jgi:hypothetical protein